MTDPAPSTDPAADPANPGTDPANPPADPPAPTDPPADPPADPADENDPRVKRANSEAAKYRTERNQLQQQLEEQGKTLQALAAVLNPQANPEADPAAQLATITSEAESLRNEVTGLRAELMVHTLAGKNGGDPVALLDSRGFLSKLSGLDPAADDYSDQVAAAIKAAVTENKNLAASGQVPSRGGAPGAGQGSEQPAGAVTQEQFNAMSYQDRGQLFRTNPELYRRLAG
jgi:hypothetical protein